MNNHYQNAFISSSLSRLGPHRPRPTGRVSTHAVLRTTSGNLRVESDTQGSEPISRPSVRNIENEAPVRDVPIPLDSPSPCPPHAPVFVNPTGECQDVSRGTRVPNTDNVLDARDEIDMAPPEDHNPVIEVDIEIQGDVDDSELQAIVARVMDLSYRVVPRQTIVYEWDLPPRAPEAEPRHDDGEGFSE